MKDLRGLHLGTAGWQLPKALNTPAEEPVLLRYARHFNAVEINSTFYRPHQPKTFAKWAASVPEDFRFAVKMHRSVTHERRLSDIRPAQVFLDMVSALGSKLEPVLIQLPPSVVWSAEAEDFLSALREVYDGTVVLEARHPSWAAPDAVNGLKANTISGVAADPPLLYTDLRPSGYPHLVYFRLHGSPRVYWSSYSDDFLHPLSEQVCDLLKAGEQVWVVFDNTAAGAGATDALRLKDLIRERLA